MIKKWTQTMVNYDGTFSPAWIQEVKKGFYKMVSVTVTPLGVYVGYNEGRPENYADLIKEKLNFASWEELTELDKARFFFSYDLTGGGSTEVNSLPEFITAMNEFGITHDLFGLGLTVEQRRELKAKREDSDPDDKDDIAPLVNAGICAVQYNAGKLFEDMTDEEKKQNDYDGEFLPYNGALTLQQRRKFLNIALWYSAGTDHYVTKELLELL